MLAIDRVQAQLHAGASAVHETAATPPFTAFFNPDDAEPYANYAMPDAPVGGDLSTALDALVRSFRHHGRIPRFEYLEGFAPELAPALEAYGFELEDRNLLMVCTPDSLCAAPPVAQLTITRLNDDTPLETIQDFVTVQGRAFAGEDRPAASPEEATRFRERFQSVQTFLARLGGVPVGAGSMTLPHNGIAEVAGIATLSAYRRRGIAAAVTAYITRTGFDHGLSALFLTAADEDAGRVYARVGYEPAGSTLAYILH